MWINGAFKSYANKYAIFTFAAVEPFCRQYGLSSSLCLLILFIRLFKFTYTSELFLLQIEPIRNFFAALFLASIGMMIHVQFLWNHVDILLASVILVVIIKTTVIASVVKGFGYNNKTAVLVRSYLIAYWLCCFRFGLLLRNTSIFKSVGWDVSGTNRGICFCSS